MDRVKAAFARAQRGKEVITEMRQTPVSANDLGALEVQITGLRYLVHSMANRAHEANQCALRDTLRCFERRLNQEKRAMGDLTMNADLRPDREVTR
jgi:hypothetical protein